MQKKSKVLKKNPDIVARVIDDETILMPVYKTSNDINSIYTCNKAATFVWDSIDGKKSVDDIKKMVAKEFDSTEKEIDKEMTGVIKDLEEIGAVK